MQLWVDCPLPEVRPIDADEIDPTRPNIDMQMRTGGVAGVACVGKHLPC